MSDDSEEIPFKIDASLGELSVYVSGDDSEEVSRLFDEKLEMLLREAEEDYVALLNPEGYE